MYRRGTRRNGLAAHAAAAARATEPPPDSLPPTILPGVHNDLPVGIDPFHAIDLNARSNNNAFSVLGRRGNANNHRDHNNNNNGNSNNNNNNGHAHNRNFPINPIFHEAATMPGEEHDYMDSVEERFRAANRRRGIARKARSKYTRKVGKKGPKYSKKSKNSKKKGNR
jgi:hypothetical protein